ncbi:MAG: EsaB/YukD family protein [Thermofilum sp.]|jgi:uncharacterized ubiquitin-like protein YukD|nr:EsaB/YukD family protein [Thermofilum sp.]MCC6064631.1 EsaB/YukD family protein [Thermofilum sp.]
MEPKWHITILSTLTGDELELEVSPATRLEEVFKTVANVLKLNLEDVGMGYRLVHPGGAKEYGVAHFNKTLAELGIRDGDRLQLIVRPEGGACSP